MTTEKKIPKPVYACGVAMTPRREGYFKALLHAERKEVLESARLFSKETLSLR